MIAYFLLFLILAVSFAIKIPALPLPLTGYFGSYQVANAMMAEMMSWNPTSILIPRTFIVMDGHPSLHLLHYPFGSLAAFVLRSILGGDLGFWGHFQAAVAMFLAGGVLYLIVKKIFDTYTALLSSLIFSFSPMVLLMGTSFQNEALAVLFLLLAFFLLMQGKPGLNLAAGIVFSLALVARPHFLVCLPAFLLYQFLKKDSIRHIFLFIVGCVIPVSLWFGFVYYLDQTHAGVKTSLYSQLGEGRILVHPLLGSPKFYQRLAEILLGPWLTPLMFPLLVGGFFSWDSKRLPFIVWVLGSLGTIILLPQKVHDHPFYLIQGIPAASVLIALSFRWMEPYLGRIAKTVFWAGFFLLVFRFYVPPAISSRAGGWSIQKVGEEIQKLTKPEDKIIASYGTSAELLYYCHRLGWSFDVAMAEHPFRDRQERHVRKMELGYGDPIKWLEYLRSQGAKYLIIAEPALFQRQTAFADYVTSHYSRLPLTNDSALLFDLSKE